MLQPLDVDAYLARIGYSGTRAPARRTLDALHLLHPAAIPFENLDPLLGRPVRLDAASLERKLVHQRRGGYCFEHNLLFAGILTALGFPTRGLAARVLWNAPPAAARPLTHMLLLVDAGGETHLADVGFGGLTLTAPLRFEAGIEQQTPHERFRIARLTHREFVLEALVRSEWRALYRFGTEDHGPVDYEVANWYTSTYPDSIFRTSLMAARAVQDRRFTLLNGELATHVTGAASERRTLATGVDIAAVLESPLGISLPDDVELVPILDRLAAGARPAHTLPSAPQV